MTAVQIVHFQLPLGSVPQAICTMMQLDETPDTGPVTRFAEDVNCERCLEILRKLEPAQFIAATEPQSSAALFGAGAMLHTVDGLGRHPEQPVTGDTLAAAREDLDPTLTLDGESIKVSDLFQAEPPHQPLSESALMRLGATMPNGKIDSQAIRVQIQDQAKQYACYSKEALIEELCRRDEGALRKGQEAADGRMAGRLLREFVRGILYTADKADLVGIPAHAAKGDGIETILKALGAEPANARQLRLEGSMIGNVLSALEPKEAIQAPAMPQGISVETAERIRKNPNRVVPAQAETQAETQAEAKE